MGSDQALAIWATPNGKGTYWMLRQHPAELGKKTLGKITVWSTEEPDGHQPWMLLETPLAPQPQQQESAPGAPGGPARVK
jgi:hypothetical protein